LRRGRDVRKSEAEAIQEADVQLESLSLHLSSAGRRESSPCCDDESTDACMHVQGSCGDCIANVSIVCIQKGGLDGAFGSMTMWNFYAMFSDECDDGKCFVS
jgi:hypothetical protein